MHEELYLKSKDPLRFLLLGCGILLLPAAFFGWALIDGAFSFVFRFDLPIFAGCVSFGALCFLPFEKNLNFLMIPYGAVVIFNFLRFGAVSLFGMELSFVRSLYSMIWMFSAFFALFFLYFIAGGKIRSRLPLLIVPSLLIAVSVSSLAFSFPPFRVLEEITEGKTVCALSDCAAYMLFCATMILVGAFLRDDKVKEEAKRKKEQKNNGPSAEA